MDDNTVHGGEGNPNPDTIPSSQTSTASTVEAQPTTLQRVLRDKHCRNCIIFDICTAALIGVMYNVSELWRLSFLKTFYYFFVATLLALINPAFKFVTKKEKPTLHTVIDSVTTFIIGAALIFFIVSPGNQYEELNDRMVKAESQAKLLDTTWVPPQLPEDCNTVYLRMGGFLNTIILTNVQKTGIIHFRNPLSFENWVPIHAYLTNNRIYVDVTIQMPKGQYVSIKKGSISGLPEGWDRNYSSNAFEIVNQQSMPILQLFYKRPEEVHINGILDMVGNNQFLEIPHQRLFRYPSFKYPGIYGEDDPQKR